jgi:hypothetical protein
LRLFDPGDASLADAHGGGDLDLSGVLALADLGQASRPDLSDHVFSADSDLARCVPDLLDG